MNFLSKEEIGYVAGILDGEGTIAIHISHGNFIFRIQVVNSYEALLDWLMSKLGGLKVSSKAGKAHWKLTWQWMLNDKKEQIILLEVLLPHLIVKKHQAELALEFLKLCPGSGHYLTSEEELARAVLYNKLRELNKKGD